MLRRLYYWLHNIYINVFTKDVSVSLSARIKPTAVFGKHIKIGANTWFSGTIDDYSYVGENCELSADIGKFCSISPNVRVISGTHPVQFLSTSPVFFSTQKQCGYTFSNSNVAMETLKVDSNRNISIKIGNDVWIGDSVLIKGGVTIGDGAVIAMGAVVTSDIPPFAIYGGVPARLIKYRFQECIRSDLQKLEWWNKSDDWIKKNIEAFQSERIEELICRLSNLVICQHTKS